jgi:hypothetical protein
MPCIFSGHFFKYTLVLPKNKADNRTLQPAASLGALIKKTPVSHQTKKPCRAGFSENVEYHLGSRFKTSIEEPCSKLRGMRSLLRFRV